MVHRFSQLSEIPLMPARFAGEDDLIKHPLSTVVHSEPPGLLRSAELAAVSRFFGVT